MKVAGIALSDRRRSAIHLLQLVAADLAHVLGRMGRVLAFEMDVGVRGAVVAGAGEVSSSTPRAPLDRHSGCDRRHRRPGLDPQGPHPSWAVTEQGPAPADSPRPPGSGRCIIQRLASAQRRRLSHRSAVSRRSVFFERSSGPMYRGLAEYRRKHAWPAGSPLLTPTEGGVYCLIVAGGKFAFPYVWGRRAGGPQSCHRPTVAPQQRFPASGGAMVCAPRGGPRSSYPQRRGRAAWDSRTF